MEPTMQNPWLGLNTYTENDRLFGRDEETEAVFDIVQNNVQTIVYGRSGIGKSSLLRAGVFPRLRYEDFLPVYIRLEHNTDETYLAQITRKVREAAAQWKVDIDKPSNDAPGNLWDLLRSYALKEQQTGIPKSVVLVFDQFEEIFTLTDAKHKQHVDDFFLQLAAVLNRTASTGSTADSSNGFRLVICLREDYLYYLEQNSANIPSLKRNRYCLKALTREEGKEVICAPSPDLVSDEIAASILDKIDANGSGIIDPSILSLFMHELFEKGNGRITAESIHAFGDDIIKDFYEDGMRAVHPASAAFLEERLVTSDGYRHTLSYNDALAAGVKPQELEWLRGRRIVTIEKGEKNQRMVELSHDVLCPIVCKNRSERKLKEETDRQAAQAKAARRKRMKRRVWVFSSLLVAILTGIFTFMFLEMRAQRDKMVMTQARFVAKAAMELAEKEGDYVKAMALVSEVYPHDLENPDGKFFVAEAYDALRTLRDSCKIEKVFYHKTGKIRHACFSPDGKRVLTASSDGIATLWDVESGDSLFTLRGHTRYINSACFSPNGKWVLTASSDNTAILWDAENGDSLFTLRGHTEAIRFACFNHNRKQIATASDDNTAILWNAENGDSLFTLRGHTNDLISVRFSPNGKQALTASYDDTAILWNAESGDSLYTLCGHSRDISTACFSPNGKRVLTSGDNTATLWDAENGDSLFTLRGHTSRVNSACFSPDGKQIVTASDDDTAILWSAENGGSLLTLRGPKYNDVNYACFSPDGKLVATASDDKAIRLWDVESGKCLSVLRAGRNLKSPSFSPDSRRILASISYGSSYAFLWNIHKIQRTSVSRKFESVESVWATIKGNKIVERIEKDEAKFYYIMDLSTGKRLLSLNDSSYLLYPDMSLSRDGDKILIEHGSYKEKSVACLDATTGKKLYTIPGSFLLSSRECFTPNGKKFITWLRRDSIGTYCLRDAETGDSLLALNPHAPMHLLGYTADSQNAILLSEERPGMIYFWSISTGECKPKASLRIKNTRWLLDLSSGEKLNISPVCISLDGENILFSLNVKGKFANLPGIFDLAENRWRIDEKKSISIGYPASLNQNGTRMLDISDEGIARIYDTGTWECLTTLSLERGSIREAQFTPEGDILTVSNENSVSLWQMPDPQELIDDVLSALNGYQLIREDKEKYYLE